MNKAIQNKFREIHANKTWAMDETVSGCGSVMAVAGHLIEPLTKLLQDYEIKSVLDMGCGDCNWTQHVDWEGLGVRYLGADIVPELAISNKKKCEGRGNMKFVTRDATDALCNGFDLVLWRDVAIHLSNEQVQAALDMFRTAGTKYLLCTTFTQHDRNRDTETGGWRILNMEIDPFNLSKAAAVIPEHSNDGYHLDKALGLYCLTNNTTKETTSE